MAVTEADIPKCDTCGRTAIYTDGHIRGCAKHPSSSEFLTPVSPFSFSPDLGKCDEWVTAVAHGRDVEVKCGIPTKIKWEADGRYFCERHATEAVEVIKGGQVKIPDEVTLETGQKVRTGDRVTVRVEKEGIPEPGSGPHMELGNLLSIEIQEGGGKRIPVDFRFDLVNPEFVAAMAKIAHHGSTRYDATPNQEWGQLNYQLDRLVGEKSPLNHALHHICQFMMGIRYDRYDGNKSWHLVAAAYNLSMLYYHARKEEEDAQHG